MADDVPGHEHFDHGHHLHKNKKGQEKEKLYRTPESKGTHIGLLTGEERFTWNWKTLIPVGIVILLLLFVLLKSFLSLGIAILIVIVNAGIEQHKTYTKDFPLDLEILFVGTAYLAANYGLAAALVVIVAGPLIVELLRGRFSEHTFVKYAALCITALTALLLGSIAPSLFIAVLFGLLGLYFGLQSLRDSSTVPNLVSRITTAVFSSIIIFWVLPLF